MIYKALRKNYFKRVKFYVENIYLFDRPYLETDVLIVTKNNYVYDIEVKISRSDFKADFKKIKHELLANIHKDKKASYLAPKRMGVDVGDKYKMVNKGDVVQVERMPNRFYFAVPEGLVSVDEIPIYAGLLYIKQGKVIKVKEAPLLHKETYVEWLYQTLCHKFYWRCVK